MALEASQLEVPMPSKGLNISLWIAQGLLALAFGAAGIMKVSMPIADLGAKMAWVLELPNLVRFIGAAELAGAFGLLLPSVTRVKPWLTPLAGAGLVVVMILAVAFHLSRAHAN